ncbi:MAG: uroporphyrinogen decarboxylase family protein [Candidatus Heimdallarchaeota archaeon]
MTKFEIITNAFKGNATEKRPLSLWQHFPEADRTPESLAEKEIAFQKRFDLDLKKICFNGLFPVIDYGIEIESYDPVSGAARSTHTVIQTLEDWGTLEPVDPNDGELGKQVKAVSLISNYTENIIPTMATVFSPVTVAAKLASLDRFLKHLKTDPDPVFSALRVLTRVVGEFAEACLDSGANGIFFATQQAREDVFTLDEFRNFVMPFDLQSITAFRRKAEFIVMHIHGHRIHFEEIAQRYPIQAINWHDQETPPTLADAQKIFKGGLLGGLDSNGVVRKGNSNEARAKVSEALQKAGEALPYLVIAPACVIPLDTPVENLDAIIKTVRGL